MTEKQLFQKELIRTALPVTLQCLLQSSFGVVDQIMTGQLGSASIAGIGMGGKFISLYTVLISAVSTVAGIMIAQYVGKKDFREVGKSFYTNLLLAVSLAVLFQTVCMLFPQKIMRLYTEDLKTAEIAGAYLRIYAVSCIPLALSGLLSTLFRCMGAAVLPLYTSLAAAVLNTILNYVMIFGKFGFPVLGANGAAFASVISQICGCLLLILFVWRRRRKEGNLPFALITEKQGWKQYGSMIWPILICEFFWSLGENVYAAIYGHIGTGAYAAMMLTNPVQALMIGALTGVAQAAGIMIGKELGAGKYEKAYQDAKKLMLYGLAGSMLLSAVLVVLCKYYVLIFNVEESVRLTAKKLLFVYALIAPVKVQNMILGGGIIRSGGKTKYVMGIDLIGTWIFGVPLGILAAFVWNMPVYAVYFMLSLEECVRLGISFVVFRRKNWMQSLEVTGDNRDSPQRRKMNEKGQSPKSQNRRKGTGLGSWR